MRVCVCADECVDNCVDDCVNIRAACLVTVHITSRDKAIVRRDGVSKYWFLRIMSKNFSSGQRVHPLVGVRLVSVHPLVGECASTA